METDQRQSGMLTKDQLTGLLAGREAQRQTVIEMMTGVRTNLIERGVTTEAAEIHKGWDVHCFFPRTDDPNRVFHLQLYIRDPAPTIEIRVREMDGEKIKTARMMSSIGSEETAVVKTLQQPKAPIFSSGEVIGFFLEYWFLRSPGGIKELPNIT